MINPKLLTTTIEQELRHGGARKGAGRKPGILTTKTRAIAEQAVAEVTLRAMRAKFDAGELVAAASLGRRC